MWGTIAKANQAKVRHAFGASDYDKLPTRDRNVVANAINDHAQGVDGVIEKALSLLEELNPRLAEVFKAQMS